MNNTPKSKLPSAAPKADSRRKVLAQWRGFDFTHLEKARAATAKPLGSVMPKVISNLGLDRRRMEAEILKVWNHSLDPTILAHAQPTGLHKGTLFVAVDSNVWLSEIVRYRRKEILDRLRYSFGRDLILRISFRVG